MSLPCFYEENIQQPAHILSEETSKHCVQVLRMKAGERLQLTDGKGHLFTAIIMDADKKHCGVKIEAASFRSQAASSVSIAISLLKNPSRFEWFLEKVTEIGVNEIIPLICDYTEKYNFRSDRMHNILVSAMLQSRQTWLPLLHQPKKFDVFVDEDFDGIKLIAHCAEEDKRSILDIVNPPKNKLILIGPEGDFSAAEIGHALKKNFIPVTLGGTRLRSETAGMVAAALLANAG
ncbi:RsmE family RNA methyltransferase [Parafilimonas sp.]|uniref:RsmE family RNA methyltransferase n=1 Tax=Parafilimonas sp. TaxID=1969739 RepID=UPI0039E431B6